MQQSEKIAFNASEAAVALGISRPTLYQLCRREDFPVARVGGRLLFPREKLQEWLEKQAEG